MKNRVLLSAIILAGCAGGPPPPAWQANAKHSLDSFQQAYLRGDARVAEIEFDRARAELAGTGNPALVARAELIRCAARTASLEFDDCPGFEKLRAEVEASLRKVSALIDEINRKWPFERDTKIKLP